jgi:hypothetical protein
MAARSALNGNLLRRQHNGMAAKKYGDNEISAR